MFRKLMIVCSLLLDEDSRNRIEDFVIFPFPLSRENIKKSWHAINQTARKQNINGEILQLVNTIEGDGWEEEKVKLFHEMGFETQNILENGGRIKTDKGIEISASYYRYTKDTNLLAKGTKKVRDVLNSTRAYFVNPDYTGEIVEEFDKIPPDDQRKILIALRQELMNDDEISAAIGKIQKKNLINNKVEEQVSL